MSFSVFEKLSLSKFNRYLAANLADAGAETTVAFIPVFIMVLISFPEVQRKLAQEMNSAIGGRLPNSEDIKNLPYLQACISEVSMTSDHYQDFLHLISW